MFLVLQGKDGWGKRKLMELLTENQDQKPKELEIIMQKLTKVTIDTSGGNKPTRRMDASFKKTDGSVYHINVGRTLQDGETGIKRERLAIDDVKAKGHDVSFEGYGKESDYRSKKTKVNSH